MCIHIHMCVHMAKGIFREELRVHTNAVRFSFAPPCPRISLFAQGPGGCISQTTSADLSAVPQVCPVAAPHPGDLRMPRLSPPWLRIACAPGAMSADAVGTAWHGLACFGMKHLVGLRACERPIERALCILMCPALHRRRRSTKVAGRLRRWKRRASARYSRISWRHSTGS